MRKVVQLRFVCSPVKQQRSPRRLTVSSARQKFVKNVLSLESFILLSSLSLVPSILSVYKHTANLYAHRLWAMGSLDLGSG